METDIESLSFHWFDALIIILYLFTLAGIGYYHSRRQKSIKDFFLAGQGMGWLPIGVSLMAALNSGIDYIMQPSAMIRFGLVILVSNLTWLLIYPYAFYFTLPLFRRLNAYSAYEYLERRFGIKVRALAASIFILWRIGWLATALYVPCLAISTATGNLNLLAPMIIVIGSVVTFYTMIGGMKAVIWADVMQFCIMAAGLVGTVIVVTLNVPGGLNSIFQAAPTLGNSSVSGGNASPVSLHFFFIPMTAIGLFISAMVTRLATYTSDQVMVQRFQTTKSIAEARRGFFVTGVSDVLWMVLLGFVGVALHQYFQGHTLPPEIVADPDRIFPYFMTQVFPVGMKGLVVAAILAASLSSIDSALNSLTSVVMVDFYGRLIRGRLNPNEERSPVEQRREVGISRLITVVIAVVGIFMALNVSRLGTILEISNKIINGFTGPILGIFLLGMFTRRANQAGVFVGGLIGSICTIYAILWSSPELMQTTLRFLLPLFDDNVASGGPVLSFVWPSTFGLLATLLIGYTVSLIAPGDAVRGDKWNWFAITRRPLVETESSIPV